MITQKKHFEQKIEQVQRTLWDKEFKRYKIADIREEIRQLLDSNKSKLSVILAEIEKQKESPTREAGEIARLDDQVILLNQDIERNAKQIEQLDIEVGGASPSTEYPKGVSGINQEIEALNELIVMLKKYQKNGK